MPLARLLTLVFLLAPGTVFASCPETTVLSCPIGKKQLAVCLTGTTATYSFGPQGRPELTLSSSVAALDYTPWNGIGRSIWETVAFHNGPTSYEVWASVDRMAENPRYEGGVNVLKNGALIAQLTCNPGSEVSDLGPLEAAKTAAGLCWGFESRVWGACQAD